MPGRRGSPGPGRALGFADLQPRASWRPVLLERSSEFDRLTRCLEAAATGQGCVVAVLGEAGIGKTSLIEAFAREVAGRARVLRSACDDLAISEPLGPLWDLAREADVTLARSAAAPVALFSEVLGFLSAGEVPTLIAIEDIHWADDATLDFVRYIGRRVARTRIIMVLTARNESSEARKRVRRAVADIPAEALVRIEVPPLSVDAVAELARATRIDPRALHRATGGNAFFVTEAVLSGSAETTPAGIEDTVLLRADRLASAARAVLDRASVFPSRVEAATIAALLGPDAGQGIQDCIGAGLLVEVGPFVQFRHEMARRVVERSLGAARRRDINARVLDLLLRRGDTPPVHLVHHAREAGDFELIHDLAPDAARQASQVGAHREAASILAASLGAPGGDALPDRANRLVQYATELHLTGRIAEAMECLVRALAVFRETGDRLREGDGLRWMSRLNYLAGQRAAADAYGREAVACLESLPEGPELAMARSNLSQLAMLADEVEPALEHGRMAADLARRLDRPDILSHALNNMGAARHWIDPQAGRRELEDALALALQGELQEHAARAYTNLAYVMVLDRDHIPAGRVLEEGIGYCTDRDLDTWRDYMGAWQAELLLRIGRWDDAAAWAQRVLSNPMAPPLARFPACVALARLRVRRGDAAGELVREAEDYLVAGRELQRLATYALLLAERAWISGEGVATARDHLREVLSLRPNASLYRDVAFWARVLSPDADGVLSQEDEPPADMPFETAVFLSCRPDADVDRAMAILEDLQATAALTRVLRDRPGQRARSSRADGPDRLTPRERDILEHLNRGLSNKAIARALGISPKTVDHHVSAVIAKLEATSRAHAAAVARERGLV